MRSLLLAVVLFITSFAYAQPNMQRHARMMDDLKLNDAQKDQFEKITFETQKKQIELRSKLETARLELQRLMDADSPEKSAIEKKFNEIASAQTALKMNHVNCWFEKNKVLTPEQQKIWKRSLHQRMKVAHMGMQRMRDDQPQRMRIERRMMLRDADEDDDKDRD